MAEYDNGKTIVFDELREYVYDRNYDKRYRVKSEAYRHALEDLMERQLKRVDFFERHLDTNTVLIQSLSRIINEALVANYFEKEYLSKYTSDDYARKVYGIMDRRVAYREIVLKKPARATKSELARIEKKALAIKAQIEKGADFDALVKKYSQDEQAAQDHGYKTPVAWMQSLSDPSGNVIFSLKENEVRVLSTKTEYSVVKVTGIEKVPVEPFEKTRAPLIKYLRQVYTQPCLDQYNKDKDALLDTASIRWNETALKQLTKWSNISTYSSEAYEDSLARAMSTTDNKTIMTYRSGKVDYKEYLRLLKNVLTINVKRSLNEDDIKYFIKEAVTNDKIAEKAGALGLRKEFFNPFTTDPEIRDRLVYFYNQAEIEQRIPPLTEDNLRSFYDAHKDSLFYDLERRIIYVMVFGNQGDAKQASAKIKSGTEFEKVTGRYLVETYDRQRDGEFKTFGGREKPIFAPKAFTMKLNEVSEPVEFTDEGGQTKYAILKCNYARPAKQLTYEEAKKTIDEEFKNFYRDTLENAIKRKLADQYHAKYYYDVVEKMISPSNAE
ncbi:MAG TPA: peptidyl-prolyl cis-trans isomerase [Bacteroidota bacterium]|nr:peptidyl-prolyl cis-trans isomerase [Bacteroidota bacterium]